MDNKDLKYSLKLDIFEGPLDLLLTLIRDKDLDIYELSLAEVTEQYLDYVDMLKEFNFENIGDYLSIAAELARLKSRSLLPKEEIEEPIEDESIDLVEMLKEYKKYRGLSTNLYQRSILGRDIFKRYQTNIYKEDTIWEVEKTNIWRLVSTVKNVLNQQNYIDPPDISIQQENLDPIKRKSEILSLFKSRKNVKFNEIFFEKVNKEFTVLTFLIILELVKDNIIDFSQTQEGLIEFFTRS